MKKECFLSYNKAIPVLTIVLLLVLGFALLIPLNNAYAEVSNESYVNFNQMVMDNYINYIGDNNIKIVSNLNYDTNDKLYIRATNSGGEFIVSLYSSNSEQLAYNGYGSVDLIVTNNAYRNIIRTYTAGNVSITNFNIINLTKMFGSGQEPSLEKCHEYFITTYQYTSGYPIQIDGIESFNEGVAKAMSSMQYTEISSDLANNMDTCVVNSNFGSTSKALIQGYFTWGNNTYTNTTAILGLGATLLQNDYITFKYKCLGSQSTLSLPPTSSNMNSVSIYGLGADGTMYKIATCEGYVGDTFKEVSFKIPFDLENLYLVADGQKYIVAYNNFELDITTMNLTAVLNHAYSQGQKQLRSYYSIGGEGYSQIYQQGVADGIAQGNAFSSGLSIIGTTFTKVGEIMSLEILPNIPLSVFVLLPLMVGLIIFIVKMTKGS